MEPSTIGERIDLWHETRQERLAIQRELESKIKDLKSKEEQLEIEIMEQMGVEGLETAGGVKASVSKKTTVVGRVDDWDAFYTYIHQERAFDLLQKRITNGAYRERVEAGMNVPGVKEVVIHELSLHGR